MVGRSKVPSHAQVHVKTVVHGLSVSITVPTGTGAQHLPHAPTHKEIFLGFVPVGLAGQECLFDKLLESPPAQSVTGTTARVVKLRVQAGFLPHQPRGMGPLSDVDNVVGIEGPDVGPEILHNQVDIVAANVKKVVLVQVVMVQIGINGPDALPHRSVITRVVRSSVGNVDKTNLGLGRVGHGQETVATTSPRFNNGLHLVRTTLIGIQDTHNLGTILVEGLCRRCVGNLYLFRQCLVSISPLQSHARWSTYILIGQIIGAIAQLPWLWFLRAVSIEFPNVRCIVHVAKIAVCIACSSKLFFQRCVLLFFLWLLLLWLLLFCQSQFRGSNNGWWRWLTAQHVNDGGGLGNLRPFKGRRET